MLFAVDTNVVMDLAAGVDDVRDAIELIRAKVKSVQFVLPPTVFAELVWISKNGSTAKKRENALAALKGVPSWGFSIESTVPKAQLVLPTAELIRLSGLLPWEEVHDSKILAESGLLRCDVLLTTDDVLASVNHVDLKRVLGSINAPLISRPRDLIKKFHFDPRHRGR